MSGPKGYDVTITVVEIREGRCPLGFKVGDRWRITDDLTPPRMCQSAFTALFPTLRALRYGGRLPWMKGDSVRVSCPDADRVLVYELKRTPKPGP
jgi:uncharacterized repeat protein (TIGR04076 family)